MKNCSVFYFFKLFSVTFIFLSYGILFCSTSPGTSLWSLSHNISLELDAAFSGGGGSTSDISTPIEQADFSGGTYTISSAGTFHLSESVTGDISIEASKVYLNLNNYTCTGNIDVTTGLEKIKIRNGFVVNGNVIVTTSNYIRLEDIVVDSGYFRLNTSDNCRVLRCCSIGSSTYGMSLSSSRYNLIEDCRVIDSVAHGYIVGEYNVIKKCCVVNVYSAAATANGFVSNGQGSLFIDCIAKNIGTASSTYGFGFKVENTANVNIVDCVVDTVTASTDITAIGFFVVNCNDCLIKKCKAFNCGYGFYGTDADVFNGTDGNGAIQNIAYNSRSQNYFNFPATGVQNYDPVGADSTTYFDNIAIPDNT